MKRNFRMKSVIPTIQSTSQKLELSKVGFKKIKLPKEKHQHLTKATYKGQVLIGVLNLLPNILL